MERLRGAVAHDVDAIPRTIDAALLENVTFASMLLNQRTLDGLERAGFLRPSPIQRCAIPVGRCGTDLIVQAKSGTGKTLVFGIIALEMIDLLITQPQVLILVPTREIAVQIKEVLTSISVQYPNLKIEAFIGGLAVSDDVSAAKGCQIAVGTPGRVKQLIKDACLSTKAVRLFVLDEADRMVDKTFHKDVCFIFSHLPDRKQSIVTSATYPEKMEKLLTRFLVHPQRINPSSDTLLLGLRQFVAVVPTHTNALARIRYKTKKLLDILSSLVFKQCLIFCNIQSRMESICQDMAGRGWPALHLSGSMPQTKRLAAIAALQNQRCRILLTTDLAARGVDAEQVDLVVNLDLPYDTETYLHRIGRAGRFGAPGIAISIVDDKELIKLREIFYDVGGASFHVPQLPDEDIAADIWNGSVQLDVVSSVARVTEQEEFSDSEETFDEKLIFRAALIKKMDNYEPIPFHRLNASFQAREKREGDDLDLALKFVEMSLNRSRVDLLKNDALQEEESEENSLESEEKEEESSDDDDDDDDDEPVCNRFWLQQDLYIREMCRYASFRNNL